MPEILQNAVKITEGGEVTYLISTHRHHYNSYTFKDGKSYAVDGGHDYIRRGFSSDLEPGSVENYNLGEDYPIKDIRDKLLWGSRGKDGKSPVVYKPFKELELEHLKAILTYNKKLHQQLSELQINVIKYWIDKKSNKSKRVATKSMPIHVCPECGAAIKSCSIGEYCSNDDCEYYM